MLHAKRVEDSQQMEIRNPIGDGALAVVILVLTTSDAIPLIRSTAQAMLHCHLRNLTPLSPSFQSYETDKTGAFPVVPSKRFPVPSVLPCFI